MATIETDKAPVKEYSEPDDHEKFSHYVNKEDLERAIFDGVAIRALCGKLWVPTRDATKFPVCPDCKKIFEDDEAILKY